MQEELSATSYKSVLLTVGVATAATVLVLLARKYVNMGELDATLTQLNNTINNTISDTLPVLGLQEEKNLICRDKPILILGETYVLSEDEEEFKAKCKSFLWFSYRRNFRAIGGTTFTSDRGWGCMLRCIQMLYSHTLLRHYYWDTGRAWRWPRDIPGMYNTILRDFLDDPNGIYSIQQIAKAGCSAGKDVGTWFGPNTAAQSIKILKEFDKKLNLCVNIVMDNFMCIEDIKFYAKEDGETFSPLLLIVPLRLGLNECNEVYTSNLKHCFDIPQSVGAIGGRPNSAFYFIGYQDDKLLYLDPHVTQESVPPDDIDLSQIPDETYHTEKVDLLPLYNLDPSIAVGFYCHSEDDFDRLCNEFEETILKGPGALFEMTHKRPAYMSPPSRTPLDKLPDNYTAEYDEVNTEDCSDSDGFEIISNS